MWANNNQTQPKYGQRSQKLPQQPSQVPKKNEIKQKQKEKPGTIFCQICSKNNHSVVVCYHTYGYYGPKDEVPQALATMNFEDLKNQQFYVDSRATAHMTNITGNLVQYSPYVGYDKIYVGNGKGLHILHISNTILKTPHDNLKLNKVLVVHI